MAAFTVHFRLYQRRRSGVQHDLLYEKSDFMKTEERIMKRNTIVRAFAIAAVTALAISMTPTAKADDKGCSTAALKGTFAYTATGFLVAAPAPIGPYGSAGTQTFDGKGGTIVTGMTSANGNIAQQTNTGTYIVNSDCTGTFTLQIAPGVEAHFFFAIADNGNEYQAVCLDPVAVITRVGRKLYPGREI